MEIACIVLGAVAVILGIVIVIVLLRDRKKKTVKTESQVATDSVASKAENFIEINTSFSHRITALILNTALL